MNRIIFILLYFLIFNPLFSFNSYDGARKLDEGFFIAPKDSTISGIIAAIIFGLLIPITTYLCKLIGERDKGFLKYVSGLLYIVMGISCIALIVIAFTLWHITLTLFIIYVIGLIIYMKVFKKN